MNLAPGDRIVRPMAKSRQREDRVHHRGIDRSEAFASLKMCEHPLLCFAQSLLPQRLPRQLLVKLQSAVHREEKVLPGDELLAPVKRGELVRWILEQFVHVRLLWHSPVRTNR